MFVERIPLPTLKGFRRRSSMQLLDGLQRIVLDQANQQSQRPVLRPRFDSPWPSSNDCSYITSQALEPLTPGPKQLSSRSTDESGRCHLQIQRLRDNPSASLACTNTSSSSHQPFSRLLPNSLRLRRSSPRYLPVSKSRHQKASHPHTSCMKGMYGFYLGFRSPIRSVIDDFGTGSYTPSLSVAASSGARCLDSRALAPEGQSVC